jgi:hypothetical protein
MKDADQYIEAVRAGIALTPDHMVLTRRVHAVEPWGQVVLTGSLGTLTDGGPVEITVVALTTWNSEGLVTRNEIYEPDDADAAVARLHALAPFR